MLVVLTLKIGHETQPARSIGAGVTDAPIFSERAFLVEIDDEGSGEFVVIRANTDSGKDVAIDTVDWPALREAVDRMIGECRQ